VVSSETYARRRPAAANARRAPWSASGRLNHSSESSHPSDKARSGRETPRPGETIVVITDRNDLDDQLFGTFARCRDLLRQDPAQATDRADLREKLRVAGGGVVFTTIQKFMPAESGDRNAVLSDRRNIVVIADEAHRSQYDFIDGFARHMRDALPQASFVGFTGTPIEKADANTQREHATRARARSSVRIPWNAQRRQ
jgi:type I site-specific restriction-modification system R (restriction) subunit